MSFYIKKSEEEKIELGIVYTPQEIAKQICQQALDEYDGENAPLVFDLGCGTGVFTYEMRELLREEFHLTEEEANQQVIGFDIDEEALSIAKSFNLNVQNRDVLTLSEKADIVIGNPPYVRIQNLPDRSRLDSYEFIEGDTDLYIAFMEKSLKIANIVALITPNSWLTTKSARKLRNYVIKNHRLCYIHNFGTEKVFPGISTYCAISVFTKESPTFTLNGSEILPEEIKDEIFDIHKLNVIRKGDTPLFDLCDIRTGLATLADKIYFGEFPELELTKPCVKASKTIIERKQIIFPYKDAKLISEEELSSYPKTYEYLLSFKEKLIMRDSGKIGNDWWKFGRSQGLKNFGPKLLLPPIQKDIHCVRLDDEECWYISGYAAFPTNISLDNLEEIFASKDMHEYIHLMARDASGGYKSINKTMFKNYLV